MVTFWIAIGVLTCIVVVLIIAIVELRSGI